MNHQISIRAVEENLWCGHFEAMKSPCEIWLESADESLVKELMCWAMNETLRIESKYSRFQPESFLSYINSHAESWIALDVETEALIEFAEKCWKMTGGLIDVTIGAYFEFWKFDGKTPAPSRKSLKDKSTYVGWERVQRSPGKIYLSSQMKLDFGGIGKEYAVDLVATRLSGRLREGGVMVNFGGDLNAIRARKSGHPWRVSIEAPGLEGSVSKVVKLYKGAIATSGDTKRYVVDQKGKVLGHILNPKTGWPVSKGPASVTVFSENAMQSGLLATLGMLQGAKVEAFLESQEVDFYCQWR